jgi:hypothetical protein
MKLFFCDKHLGDISDLEGDQPWWYGRFNPTIEAVPFQDIFAWCVDEEKNSSAEEPPFDQAWWTDENWFIEDEEGRKRGIWLPAIYGDGWISWRWR